MTAEGLDVKLFLAILWLVLGVGLFVWPAVTGGPGWRFPLGDTSFSVGWVALALALYNLAGWFVVRAYRAEVRARQQAEARRQRFRPSQPIGDPDPTFNFTDDPPPAENKS
jgi:hypothetical protein